MQLLASLPVAGEAPVSRFPGETHVLGEQKLFVRRCGEPGREPMLFIHGLGGFSTNWTDLMACLEPVIDGHALDLPGFGFSGPSPDGRYSPQDHVTAVLAYLDHALPGQKVHVVGNSMGGLIATVLAAQHPERVASLTLVSPALPDVRPVVLAGRVPLLAGSFFGPILLRPIQKGTAHQRARKLLGLCFADPSRIPSARIDEVVEDYRQRADFEWGNEAFLASLRGIVASTFARGDDDVWQLAKKVEVPVLWIHGKQDQLVHWGLVRRGARSFRNCSTLLVDDSGHVTQMEHPELTATAVLAHLTKAHVGANWSVEIAGKSA